MNDPSTLHYSKQTLIQNSLRTDSYSSDVAYASEDDDQWKASVIRSVSVIDSVLSAVNDPSLDKELFADAVSAAALDDPLTSFDDQQQPLSELVRPAEVAERLSHIISHQLPSFAESSRLMLLRDSKPSRLTRYWIPGTLLLISASTLLRIVVNRKAEIVQWVRELGSTVIDFWRNWVIEPTRKIIGTIRHDEESEVSIVSKRSLEGDRASLERMVVDFAVDNPEGSSLNTSDIAAIRSKVHEGDLTPVLRAYEKDLKSPFYGTVRGNLVRALLIQVQKTKVDVEIAMGGIDNLLKSQELVFG